MFCDVLKPGGEPYEGDPRFVMRRALARAKDMGFDTFNLGPELEFFYFASDDLPEDGVPEILDKGGYFDLTTLDAASDLRRDTVNALKAVGIPVEYTHHEVGPSQHEIDMRYAEGLKMSDAAMTYRIVVKEIAAEHGVYATFMPKPLFGENGSGMHTHQSLFSEGKNAFYDARGRPSPRRRRRSPTSRASSATRARSPRCSPPTSTPTSGWCPATRLPSTAPGRSGTARRWFACRCITPERSRRRAASSAAPIPPAIPT